MMLRFAFVLFFLTYENCEGCLNNIYADIVFTLDESSASSSSYGAFPDVLDAVSESVRRLNIDGSGRINVGVAGIHNVSYVRTIFNLGAYSTIDPLQSAIEGISKRGLWGTDMALGLQHSCFQMFGGAGDRNYAPNYLIYITHGWTNLTIAPSVADDCRAAGINLGIFAIDSSADSSVFLSMVSSSNYYVSTSFKDGCIAGDLSRLTYLMTSCQWYCDSGSGLVLGRNPSYSYPYNGGNTGYTYISLKPAHQFMCCGRIKTWEFRASNSGTLTLQVWKWISGSTYQLTGTNTLYIPNSAVGHLHTYIVPNNERITVNIYDYFGWHSSDLDIIPYNSVSSFKVISKNVGHPIRGMTYSFSSPTTTYSTAYAIRVTLENDDANFWFPDSGHSVTVFDHEGAGTSIFQWSAVQKDQEYLTYGIQVAPLSSQGSFTYTHPAGTVTGDVQLASKLSNGRSYTLTFEATDTCTHCGRGTLNVKVKNLPPRILSLPSFYEIHEDADISSGIIMHTLVTADDSGDSVTCSKNGVTPSSANSWLVVRNSGGTSTIRLSSTASLNFDTASEVRLRVRCTDGKDADTGYFKLFLRRNTPPSITNMFTHLDWVASTYASGSALVTPVADDSDSSSFTYEIDYCGSPPVSNSCPARIVSTSTGALVTNQAMSSFTNGGFNIRVNISDGKTETGPYPLSVRVYDLNDRPVIFNLPMPDGIAITEAIPPFTWLYTVQFYDVNNWNTLTLSTSISPAEGYDYFEITKTIHSQDTVKTSSKQINYETLTSKTFTVRFELSDGRLSRVRTLTISVENENEGISFVTGSYTLAADEGPVDTVVGDPGFQVTHVDNENDPVQYSFDCGTNSRYFKMDRLSGLVSFAWNMDVDKGYTRQSVCTVTAWDSGYLTATTKLTITIYDVNDNAPRFDQKYYTYWTTALTPPDTILGTISITDADITHPHNFIEKVWIENQPNNIEYFSRNSTTGEFFINQNLSSIGDGNVLEMTIYAEDYGHLKSSAQITVIMPSETTTTSTTTTDVPLNILDKSATTAWVSIASVAAIVFMGLAFYMTCAYASSGGSPTDKNNVPGKKKQGRGRDIVFRDGGIC